MALGKSCLLAQTIACRCTACLNVPLAVTGAQSVQTELICHLCSRHGIGQILLVGKDQQYCIAEFILVEHSVHLISRSINTISVIGIHNEDKPLCILIIVSPKGTDLILTSYIPHCK